MHAYRFLDSPIGTLTLFCDERALTGVHFGEHHELPPPHAGRENPSLPLLREASRQLTEYFRGQRRDFELPLDLRGTPFQQQVWAALRTIPFGQTQSYGELARRIGHPAASRAVGLANGRNPIPIIVPCHRVIGADGSLTGFGGGLPRKQWLLEHEGVGPRRTLPLPL